MTRFIYTAAVSVCALLLCASCLPGSGDKPTDGIQVSEIFKSSPEFIPDGDGKIEIRRFIEEDAENFSTVTVQTFSDEEIRVGRIQLLASKDIVSVKALERTNDPGRYNLELTLTKDGVARWNALSKNAEEKAAFIKDGIFLRSFLPRRIYDQTSMKVVIDGPFDIGAAKTIELAAEKNFKEAER